MSKTKQKACLERGRRVIVAMSGGVDSSVAVFLLKKAGYEVEGVTMKTVCYKSEEILNAKKVCKTLGIPHHTIDVSKKFQKKVIDNFFTEYKAGRTPNPCVKCNQFIKFGELLKFAKKKGADFLATGHYAKIVETRHASSLHRGKDLKKDQTYFLYNLTQKQLSQILFPLGDYNKEDIKKIAKKH
ncbi:MAG: 7-cyano-7-deazaguanine synthase, partial [Patescibacteria group bacterium]|nr:7-cyano-7-deazaguanine synthase [Patescibacteria group bacterium]